MRAKEVEVASSLRHIVKTVIMMKFNVTNDPGKLVIEGRPLHP